MCIHNSRVTYCYSSHTWPLQWSWSVLSTAGRSPAIVFNYWIRFQQGKATRSFLANQIDINVICNTWVVLIMQLRIQRLSCNKTVFSEESCSYTKILPRGLIFNLLTWWGSLSAWVHILEDYEWENLFLEKKVAFKQRLHQTSVDY